MTRNPDTRSFPRWVALLLAAVAGALSLSPAAASAQGLGPLHFSAGAGVVVPAWGRPPLLPGYQVQVAAELDLPRSPNAFRLQLLFDHFGASYTAMGPEGGFTVTGHERLIAGTLDLLVALPSSLVVTPYVVLGGGLFNHRYADCCSIDSSDDPGFDVGTGLRLPWHHAFVEGTARIMSDGRVFIPIVVAVRF